MSQLRRRSQDARSHQSSMEPTLRQVSKSSKLATTTVLIFVVFAGLLLARLRWNPNQDLPTISTSSLDQPNRLSPEQHVFRQATTINQRWRITSGLRRPDGVLKRVYLINDSFPGPTIECRSGDRVVIEVENALEDEDVSMHWHGLTMRGANEMDGAIGITNTPIESGRSFTYDFKIEDSQSGSFWYHSHHNSQRADGLYGAFIVHKPKTKQGPAALDSEHVLLVGDWYHRAGEEALHSYSHPGAFGIEAVPDSVLINGQGMFNCSNVVPARPVDCDDLSPDNVSTMLNLDPSRRNVVRIVNVGSYAGIGFSGLQFLPIAVDGDNQIIGRVSKSLEYLYPGERVDVVIQPNGNVRARHTALQVSLDSSRFKYSNPSLMPIHTFSVVWTDAQYNPPQLQGGEVSERSDLQSLQSIKSSDRRLPTRADQQIVLYAKTQKMALLKNEPRGFINHTSWRPQTSPPQPLRELDRGMWDENQLVPHIDYIPRKPLWVDIVLNNLDEESHPFHLHGYDFWVLATYSSTFNWGSFNPFEDDSPPGGTYNLLNPVRKDTVYVPRHGYAVLRFRADNPGIWMFHCHVMVHQSSGMAMAFEVGP